METLLEKKQKTKNKSWQVNVKIQRKTIGGKDGNFKERDKK